LRLQNSVDEITASQHPLAQAGLEKLKVRSIGDRLLLVHGTLSP
jgi:hypothetical protein